MSDTTSQGQWLRGGHLIDPAQDYDAIGDVLIQGDTVLASGNPNDIAARAFALRDKGMDLQIIELPSNYIVTPGFIDLHVHLREPGLEARETIRSGSRAAARGGYTTICCMPNTVPILDNRGIVEWIKTLSLDADARVLPIAAITQGQAGETLTEMAELSDAGAVAFSDDGKPVRSSGMMRLALSYALTLDRPIVNHCEDPELVGKGVMNAGAMATRLGLAGWPAAGETIMLYRDLELTRLTGGRYHAAHLSTATSVELVRRAKADNLRVTAEVTPHHLLLSDAWVAGEREGLLANGGHGSRYDTATKVNPPLRTLADTDALANALRDGTIDVIATDHAPHSAVEKHCPYDEAAFGISGIETALGSVLALYHKNRVPLARIVAALTSAPARCFNLTERIGRPIGTLATGASADITIFDPDATWTVAPEQFASQGLNSPLAGITLRGRVLATLLSGRFTYEAEGSHFQPLSKIKS
jgi:dihydroorotase